MQMQKESAPHKSYLAFDPVGVALAERNNLRYFHRMFEWQRLYPERFDFVNSEDIEFYAEHGEKPEKEMKIHFIEQMREADHIIVPASETTNVEAPLLNWQISQAVNGFRLPVIVCYLGMENLLDRHFNLCESWMPAKIRKYISRDSALIAHIPFTRDKLERAIASYSLKDRMLPWNSTTIF